MPASPTVPPPSAPKARRGFACLSPERRREMAAKGGSSVDPTNRAYARDPALASSAGRKGGTSTQAAARARKSLPTT